MKPAFTILATLALAALFQGCAALKGWLNTCPRHPDAWCGCPPNPT